MLQNRVDPFGNLIMTVARGLWTGTRGLIHNDKQEIIRSFKLKAWITCRLEFKGRKRIMMLPKKYTELFFLDEATAFSAGHRPCCECRRDDFNRFKSYWLKGNAGYHFDERTSIQKIDAIIHKERIGQSDLKVTFQESVTFLPNGVFVLFNEKPFLILNKMMHLWSPAGYENGIPLPNAGKLIVLTPRSIVNAIKAGYEPQMSINAML